MPVSTEHRPAPKRCKHCEEANHGDSVYWNIQLDQDLFNTIVSIYPEWFKGSMNKNNGGASSSGMASSDGSTAQVRSSTATAAAATTTTTSSASSSPLSSNSSSSASSCSGVNGAVQQQQSATTTAVQATLAFPRSPPKAEVDDSPLRKSMDRNKQSLKVKLMLRRPITQLVAQGIMPQLKISPTIHEQRQKLERAKMGDLLRAKIQQRPDRQELVRQHILEADVGHVDPSLAERHRMLKKCRLVDSLNDQLSHRPGPLELIKKNILHTDETIERAVKEGHIEFRATCEGQKVKLEPPDHYMTIDDDSQSSDSQSPRDANSFIAGADLSPPSSNGCVSQSSSPSLQSSSTTMTIASSSANNATGGSCSSSGSISNNNNNNSNNTEHQRNNHHHHHHHHNVYSELFSITASDMLETAAKQAGIVTVVVPSANLVSSSTAAPSPISIGSSTSSLSPMSSVASPSSNIFSCASPALSSRSGSVSVHHQSSSGRDRSRKKSKSKSQQQKARTIKFHEYKGPPSAHRHNSNSSSANSETSYDLLLKQQQLFLQWQLEWQQKYPQLKMPITSKSSIDHVPPSVSPQLVSVPSPSPSAVQIKQEPLILTPSSTPPPAPPPLPSPIPTNVGTKLLRNLEDMKVSDLKAELKKRNLPMSGPKPSLILRLKPFTEVNNGSNINNHNSNSNSSTATSNDYTSQNANNNGAQSNRTIPYSEESLPDSSVPSPMQHQVSQVAGVVEHMDVSVTAARNSPQPMIDTSVNKVTSSCVESSSSTTTELTDEEIIKEQQKKIEELQRQLLNSQLLLQQQRQQQLARSSQTFQPQQAISAKANLAAFLQQQQLNHLLIQQQQKLQQKQSRIQQANGIVNNSNNNNNNNSNNHNGNNNNNNTIAGHYGKQPKPNNVQVKNEIPIKSSAQRQRSNTVILGERPVTLMLNHVNLKPNLSNHNPQRTSASLPNFVGTFVQPQLVLANDGSIQHLVIDNDTIFVPDHPVKPNVITSTAASNNNNNNNGIYSGVNVMNIAVSSSNIGNVTTVPSIIGIPATNNNNNNNNNSIVENNRMDSRPDVVRKISAEQQQRLLFDTSIAASGQKIVLENVDGGRIILENGTNRLILKDGSQFVFTNSSSSSSIGNSNDNSIGVSRSRNHHSLDSAVKNAVIEQPDDYASFESIPMESSCQDDDNNNADDSNTAGAKLKPAVDDFNSILEDNNEISELFKHDGERSIEDVDDVLDMLMGSEEFLSIGGDSNNNNNNNGVNDSIGNDNDDADGQSMTCDFSDVMNHRQEEIPITSVPSPCLSSASSSSSSSSSSSPSSNGHIIDDSIYTFQNNSSSSSSSNLSISNNRFNNNNNNKNAASLISNNITDSISNSNSCSSSSSSNGMIVSKGDIADPDSLPSDHVSLEALGLDVESFPPMDLMEQDEQHHHDDRQLRRTESPSDFSSIASKNHHHHHHHPVAELMDVDNDWLDRLISSEFENAATLANLSSIAAVTSPPPQSPPSTQQSINSNNHSNNNNNYDPMISGGGGAANISDPLDFFSIDDNDYKMAAEFCWDRVDFAT